MKLFRIAPFVLLLAGAMLFVAGRASAQVRPQLSLLEQNEEAIDTALEDTQPGAAAQNVYISSSAAPATMAYNKFVRNVGLWIGPKVDLSAISAYSDNPGAYGSKFAITAISPLHCLGAAHCASKPGTRFNFVGADNTTVMRTIVAAVNPVGDVEVYLLNQPLPPSVTPMRIMPRNWADYLQPGTELDMPVIFINQQNRLYLAEAEAISPGLDPMVVYHFPSGFKRQQFNAQVISGDSSFPEMVLVKGQPVLLSLWHFGGYGAGPLEAAHFDAINTAMRKLSRQFSWPPGVQLTPADLSGIARLF